MTFMASQSLATQLFVQQLVQADIKENIKAHTFFHYDVKSQSFNPGLQYPHLHGPVHTPDNNRWDTPPV